MGERDLDRFLAFIDAIVAIAITLLVLPLADIADEVGDGTVADLLVDHQAEIYGFLISFAVIARLWLGYHRIVRDLVRQDPLVVWLTLAWTLTIVVLPFTTALATEASKDATTKTLYIGTMALSSALLALLAWVIRRNPRLTEADTSGMATSDIKPAGVDGRPDPLVSIMTTAGFLLALTISLTVPATGYWPLLLLLITNPLAHRFRTLQQR
jgi:uncharacterized membrane protein